MNRPSANCWLPEIDEGRLRQPGFVAAFIGSVLGRSAAKRPFDSATTEYFVRQKETATGAWKYYEQFLKPGPSARLRVLDIGCGPGARTAKHAAETDASFFCVDVDLGVLGHDHGNATHHIHFTQADATNLPFAAETFDVCLCENVLEHFERPDLAVRELTRVLRAGGHLLAMFPPWRGPFSGHLRHFTSLPWIHLLPARVIVALLVAIQYPSIVGREQSWQHDAASMCRNVSRHLNAWSLHRILDAIADCRELEPVDAYALGEWSVSRLLRFLPWCGEFFIGSVYLVYQRRSEAAHESARELTSYNDIVKLMGHRYLRRLRRAS